MLLGVLEEPQSEMQVVTINQEQTVSAIGFSPGLLIKVGDEGLSNLSVGVSLLLVRHSDKVH